MLLTHRTKSGPGREIHQTILAIVKPQTLSPTKFKIILTIFKCWLCTLGFAGVVNAAD